ncbi:MAG TPA: hypothetical protein VMD29_02220 [Terracidiphilus sp.]|nr:hypothetical protein [Terracidiphilus sp.]
MRSLAGRIAAWAALILGAAWPIRAQQQAHTLIYAPGKSITLSLPAEFDINIAAHGIRRVRFFAQSPDGRIFATAMHDISDNSLGGVLILEGWDEQKHTFNRITPYLTHLRNPNSIAFWTDPKTSESWLYVALTDKLVRYAYHTGDEVPGGPAQTLMRFPDYGLNYKYGGWHLTRTVAVAQVNGTPRIFVSVGSSCNYCQEREVARASILSMDPDGGNQKIIAQGMRNAVDLRYVADLDGGALFATNMGDDHLGDQLPDDTFFKVDLAPQQPLNYGWPTCYFAKGTAIHDTTPLPSMEDPAFTAHTDQPPARDEDSVYGTQQGVAAAGTNLAAGGGHAAVPDPNAALGRPPEPLKSCEAVPHPYAWFVAHSSPLGFAHFPDPDANLRGSFLVALHGASHPQIGAGYRVARFTADDRKPRDFITGFLTYDHGKPVVHGRPCGVFRVGPDSFLIADDYLGLVYSVHPQLTR